MDSMLRHLNRQPFKKEELEGIIGGVKSSKQFASKGGSRTLQYVSISTEVSSIN